MKDESVLFTLIIFWIGIECFNYPPESEDFAAIGRLEKTYFLKSLWKSLNTDDIILQISTNVQKNRLGLSATSGFQQRIETYHIMQHAVTQYSLILY